MSEHWNHYFVHWTHLGPPLRPTAQTVAACDRALSCNFGRVLLYGVTPEFAELGGNLVAVDRSIEMISNVWPGNTERRFAILGDWRSLPLPSHCFEAAVGDAPLNNVSFPEDAELVLTELKRVLKPCGRSVFRAFCRPEIPETLEEVRCAAFAGNTQSFHALKWRVAMACVADRNPPIIRLAEILASFNAAFPDRAALSQRTGWDVDAITSIDAYAGSAHIYSFPTIKQIVELVRSHFGDVQILESGSYPLVERCPLIAFQNL